MAHLPFVPAHDRNTYTLWYKYAHKNFYTYTRLAFKYNIARLQPPVNINHKF